MYYRWWVQNFGFCFILCWISTTSISLCYREVTNGKMCRCEKMFSIFFFSFLSNMHAFVQICQLFFSVWLILIYYRSMLIISPARPWNTLNNMGERKQSIVGKYLDYLMGAIMMIKLECVFCFFRMINAYWSSIASCWDK